MSICDPLRSLGAICVDGSMVVPVFYLNSAIRLNILLLKKTPLPLSCGVLLIWFLLF
jgi:hypothetical protein